jgi:hypothetical protein
MTIDADREPDDIIQASEQFNRLLDSLEHGDSLDELAEFSDVGQISQELQNLPKFEMPASGKATLRAAMLAEFRKQHIKSVPQRRATVWYSSRSFIRLAVAACLILAFVFGSGGLLRISAASLPGEPFYGLKRLTEQVELAFTGARSDKLYELVQTRLTEIQMLVARGQTITETVATDTMVSLNAAVQAQSDPQKREQIIGQTAIVFSEAQTQGKLSQATVLVALGTVDIPPSEFFAAGATVRATPTLVATASPVGLPADTNTMTPSPTVTNTMTVTETSTVTPVSTNTSIATYTATFTMTPSMTSTPTATYTLTPSPTLTSTPEPSRTPKPTNVHRPTKRPTKDKDQDQGGKPEDQGGGKPENPGQQGGKK